MTKNQKRTHIIYYSKIKINHICSTLQVKNKQLNSREIYISNHMYKLNFIYICKINLKKEKETIYTK